MKEAFNSPDAPPGVYPGKRRVALVTRVANVGRDGTSAHVTIFTPKEKGLTVRVMLSTVIDLLIASTHTDIAAHEVARKKLSESTRIREWTPR